MKVKLILIIVNTILMASCTEGNFDQDARYDEIDPSEYSAKCPDETLIDNFQDANKDGKTDTAMCWAATAANIVSNYNGQNENNLFQELKDNYPNEGNYVSEGIRWLGYDDLIESEWRTENVIPFIIYCVNHGRAVGVIIERMEGSSRHALSIYGYEKVSEDNYIIYFTDSNDSRKNIKKLRSTEVIDNVLNYRTYSFHHAMALTKDL